jgi:SecD/SecF fusion protein
MGDRARNSLVLLIVAILLAASAAVIATKPTLLGLDLKGGVSLIYKGTPTAQAKVTPESLERAIDIMRKRVDQLGVAQPEIQRTGSSEIDVSLPAVSNYKRAQEQVGKTAQLHFYDRTTRRSNRAVRRRRSTAASTAPGICSTPSTKRSSAPATSRSAVPPTRKRSSTPTATRRRPARR